MAIQSLLRAGLTNFEKYRSVLAGNLPTGFFADFLVIGGGGGGGGDAGGGGGAGGYRSSVAGELSGGARLPEPKFLIETDVNFSVSIGAGGVNGANGSPSSFATITSLGGGGGRGRGGSGTGPALVGGSGGGGDATSVTAGLGTSNQGFEGGNGATNPGPGAGGGAGGPGTRPIVPGSNQVWGSQGGKGLLSNITGTDVFRAGGGGGRAGTADAGGAGGTGGYPSPQPAAAPANFGGGGGGQGNASSRLGGTGGSGIVVLRYDPSLTITIGAGLTGSTATVAGLKVTTITSGSGDVSWAA